MAEIYARPIEIYAYSSAPMRTYREQLSEMAPLRLSYHGRNHYNAVVALEWTVEHRFAQS